MMAEARPIKVVWRGNKTESVALATTIGDTHTFTYPHGLPFIPYTLGAFSDDDFATSYDFGHGRWANLPTYGFESYEMLARCWADATNVYVEVISHNSARTITFHIMGLAPLRLATIPDGTIVPEPPVQDSLVFTSDFNSLKSYHEFGHTVTTIADSNTYRVTTNHVVNYPLTVLLFVEQAGKIWFGNTHNTFGPAGFTVQIQSIANRWDIAWYASIVTNLTFHGASYFDA